MAAQSQNQLQLSEDESNESTRTYQQKNALLYDDAVTYVSSVKTDFGAKSEEYQYFLHLLNDFREHRTTTRVVASRVKLLFSEHQEYIEGFNQFLPAGYKIPLPLSRRSDIRFEEALSYVTKVKAALSQEKDRYSSFLQLLNGYRTAEMSALELSQEMCELLRGRQDLLEEFFDYMPDSRNATFKRAVNSAMNDGKSRFWILLRVAMSMFVAIGMGIAVGVGV